MDRIFVVGLVSFFSGAAIGMLLTGLFTFQKITEERDMAYRKGFAEGERYQQWSEKIRQGLKKQIPSSNLKCTGCDEEFYSAAPDVHENTIHIGCGGVYKKGR